MVTKGDSAVCCNPAIDLLRSVSRQFTRVSKNQHLQRAGRIRSWLALYEEHREAIESGLIQSGKNASRDRAIERNESVEKFLRQMVFEPGSWEQTQAAPERLVKE